ncbi:MAG TPA: trypsin-like peptidase domain-containing protein [Gemmataceae bacterium]|nr:trypsin-like peptidase domain-containing protein [Gemmataceae bacterium]
MPVAKSRLCLTTCLLAAAMAAVVLTAVLSAQGQQQSALDAVRKAEAQRVAVIEKVKPSVVAIFAPGGQGGGSGVLISKDGYALTNWHVVKGGSVFRCGLADGVLYHAVLVGLDKVGDIALIKLLPEKGKDFHFAVLGDSDTVHEGDWSLAMGNPFLLATDFSPTVTYGMISGVHRYQYPSGGLLEYTDCIQIDTSINPGNSGGPLFDMKGELIGINGRGSFDKRGRINSGVGYAISINQIKNFLGQLKAGLDTDHASLGATWITQSDPSGLGRVVVSSILDSSDASRRGLDIDDEILSLDGRRINSANQMQNLMGLYPRGWRVPLEFRRGEPRDKDDPEAFKGRKEILVRLMGAIAKQTGGAPQPPPPGPKPKIVPGVPQGPSPASKFFIAKAKFANYYFNQIERDELMKAFTKQGDFSKVGGNWTLEGRYRLLKSNTASKVTIEVTEKKAADGKGSSPLVSLKSENEPLPEELEPLKSADLKDLQKPKGSGGFLPALYIYHRFLTLGVKGFEKRCDHGGHEPCYPPRADNRRPASLKELRIETDVLNTTWATFTTKWFFTQNDKQLRAFELRVDDESDPCEVYLSDYRQVDGRMLPHRMQVYHGNTHYATFEFSNFRLAAK